MKHILIISLLLVTLSIFGCSKVESTTTASPITIWEGDYRIGYQSAVDFINFLPLQTMDDTTFIITGTYGTRFTTDADGFYFGAFESNPRISITVCGGSFKIRNCNYGEIRITRIEIQP